MQHSQAEIEAAEQLAREDAAAGREALWYRCGESYISAESGHIGNTELGAAYVAAYVAAAGDESESDYPPDSQRTRDADHYLEQWKEDKLRDKDEY